MSPALTPAYFDRLSASILTGALPSRAHRFQRPLVVYLRGNVTVLRTDDEFRAMLSRISGLMTCAGASHILTEVRGCHGLSAGLERYRIRKTCLDICGNELGGLMLRYFVRRIEGAPVIEMVEYLGHSLNTGGCGATLPMAA